MIDFFKKEEEAQIIEAIRHAENQTSGEIRVHLEKKTGGTPILDVAAEVFSILKMEATEARNGVLILLVPSEKQFAIIGDEGINKVVPEHFWEDVRDLMKKHFQTGNFVQGLSEGIELVGQKLKEYFPYQTDDTNELPDDISYGA
ncbi:MAG: TPM domain-containing protein [Saprospiraceae bacterium]|nr:TPM domain-containing protein [Saprospiraceae bacterium]